MRFCGSDVTVKKLEAGMKTHTKTGIASFLPLSFLLRSRTRSELENKFNLESHL